MAIVRDTLYLSFYFGVLAGNSWLLATGSGPQWLMPILILVQGFIFVGLMEGFHQAVHMNLYAWRPFNTLLGRLLGAHLGIGFAAYRRFHIIHHATTNTAQDPEKPFYGQRASRLGLLLYPFLLLMRNANIVNKGQYVNAEEQRSHRLELISILAFRAATVVLTWFFPLAMLMAYWLPYVVFFYVELLMSQSQHYFSQERQSAPRGVEHYQESVNVNLPWPLGFLCMYTNHHATHHVHAATKWYDMPKTTHRDSNHVISIGFLKFFSMCLTQGARQWRQPS